MLVVVAIILVQSFLKKSIFILMDITQSENEVVKIPELHENINIINEVQKEQRIALGKSLRSQLT